VPHKLLLVSTGNIRNSALETLLFKNLEAIVDGFSDHDFIEIERTALRFHY
jgi:predicted nuclease of predicted toxin-antitoxin system